MNLFLISQLKTNIFVDSLNFVKTSHLFHFLDFISGNYETIKMFILTFLSHKALINEQQVYQNEV